MIERKGFLEEVVNHFLFKNIVRLADLQGGKILDFGCGVQSIKSYLPKGCTYCGYDIDPQFGLTTPFNHLPIDVAICSNVFEHMHPEQITETLKEFKRMKVKKIIVALPSEHFLSKIMWFILGIDARIFYLHITSPKKIVPILHKELGEPHKVARVNITQYVGVWNV